MAPTKPNSKKSKNGRAKARVLARKAAAAQSEAVNPRQLIADATAKFEVGDLHGAARIAKSAWENIGPGNRHAGAALTLLGQIHVELGEIEDARSYFMQAVQTDEDGTAPDDMGGGPEKFLWLAQLSDNGGKESVEWFERGAASLRRQIQNLNDELESLPNTRDQKESAIEEKKRKLAEALCAVAEVYMTDLSWEVDAEQRCEALAAEAMLLSPDLADTWQTVANIRVSQSRVDEARAALERSLGLWVDLEPEDPRVPPFPTRVALVRLLMETEMEQKAAEVADRLVSEDDSSVEVWYLGGYAWYVLGEKARKESNGEERWAGLWRSSRRWLSRCLQLFQAEEYEDDRLGDHARELLASIIKEIGEAADGEEDDGDDGWEDANDSEEEDDKMDEQ